MAVEIDGIPILEYGAYWDVSKSIVEQEGWEWMDARIMEMARAKFQVPDHVQMVVKGRIPYHITVGGVPVQLAEDDPQVKWFKVGLYWRMAKPDGNQED